MGCTLPDRVTAKKKLYEPTREQHIRFDTMNKLNMRADKTSVRVSAEENVLIEPVGFDQLPDKDDHWIAVMELTDRCAIAIPDGQSKYNKSTMGYHMGCPECDDGEGRYDEVGEVICQSCGLVISHNPDSNKTFAGTMYGDKYCQGSANEASNRNRGASGNKFIRPNSLRDPGPSGDGVSGEGDSSY